MKKRNRAESTNALLKLIMSKLEARPEKTWIILDGSSRIQRDNLVQTR